MWAPHSPEDLPGDHVKQTARRADDNLLAHVQRVHVLAHASAANAGVALRAHAVTQRHRHLLDLLGQDQSLHKKVRKTQLMGREA